MPALQLPLFEPSSDWRPPSLSELPSWRGARRIGIDTETCDPLLTQLGPGPRRGGYVVGISFAIEDGPKFYLPIRHEGGDNLPVENVLSYLRDQASVFDGDLVGMRLDYDLDFLLEEGVEFRPRFFKDVGVADPLIYELYDRYGLNYLAERYGLPGKDEKALEEAARSYKLHSKNGLWRLPARHVGIYAERDADLPLKILRRQERLIEEKDLWKIWELECELLPVLVRMRRRGVRVDENRLRGVEEWSLLEEKQCLDIVRHETGVRIETGDVWKPGSLKPALDFIGVSLPKTAAGADSISRDVLEKVPHPVAKALSRARKVNKLRTTFAASVRRYMVNGRVHATFNQMARENDEDKGTRGVRYGRLSCEDPNMQQQPARDDFADRWRSIYVAEDDCEWLSADYKQQEPRWTTHFAAIMDLPGAKEAARRYVENPKTDNHDLMTRIVFGDANVDAMDEKTFKKARGNCKLIYLGLCYGEGGAKLCRSLGLPTRWAVKEPDTWNLVHVDSQEEAISIIRRQNGGRYWEAAGEEGQRILDDFDRAAPFVRKLAKKASEVAKSRGYVITAGGRHLHFPPRDDGTYDWVHKALNRVIQGSGADQTKRALIEIDKAGYFLQLQVHDETNSSIRNREEARKIGEIMRDAIPSTLVPFAVDLEIGPSWGEAKLWTP